MIELFCGISFENFSKQIRLQAQANEQMVNRRAEAYVEMEKAMMDKNAIEGECSVVEVKLIGSGSGD